MRKTFISSVRSWPGSLTFIPRESCIETWSRETSSSIAKTECRYCLLFIKCVWFGWFPEIRFMIKIVITKYCVSYPEIRSFLKSSYQITLPHNSFHKYSKEMLIHLWNALHISSWDERLEQHLKLIYVIYPRSAISVLPRKSCSTTERHLFLHLRRTSQPVTPSTQTSQLVALMPQLVSLISATTIIPSTTIIQLFKRNQVSIPPV